MVMKNRRPTASDGAYIPVIRCAFRNAPAFSPQTRAVALGHRAGSKERAISGGRLAEWQISTRRRPISCLTARRKTFPAGSNSYRVQPAQPSFYQWFTDGTVCALGKGRRSGAQRGAPENNFGQRFSWAPLAISALPYKPFVLLPFNSSPSLTLTPMAPAHPLPPCGEVRQRHRV